MTLGRARDQTEVGGGRIDRARILRRRRGHCRRSRASSLRRPENRRERVIQLAAHALYLTHLRHALLHRLRCRGNARRHAVGHLHYIISRRLRLVGQLSYFPRHHREPSARFARTRGLDGGVQREKICLLGNPADRDDKLVDLGGTRV